MTSSPFLPFPRLGFGTGPGLFPHRADKPFFALPFIDHVDDRSRDGDFFRQELADGDDFFDFGGDEIKANKAYYTSTLPVQGFGLSFDVINAIKQAETTKAGQAIYDLSGRRVQKAVKGVYIVGGKKVIK